MRVEVATFRLEEALDAYRSLNYGRLTGRAVVLPQEPGQVNSSTDSLRPMDSAAWNERYSGQELLWSREPNRFVAEVAGALPAGRAADLACGEGRNAIWLAARGWKVVGVDFSAAALERARLLAAQAGVEVEWIEADLTSYERVPSSLDLVIFSYLHLPADSMRAILVRACSWLAPGGLLMLIGHARRNIEQGVGGPQEPSILYEPDEVVSWLDGLEVERAENVFREVGTDEGTRRAIYTLVTARRSA